MRAVLLLGAVIAGATAGPGCAYSPLRDRFATPPGLEAGDGGPPVMADDRVTDREAGDGLMVGLALSGGGSRAAVFAGEVMLELDRLGLLKQVDYVSGVSGGSIPAAYYCLSRDPGSTDGRTALRWEPEAVRDACAADIQGRATLLAFSPLTPLLYYFTGYNRSCHYAEAMDSRLFGGARLGDLNPDRPRLLINCTRLKDGSLFTLTDSALRGMHVRPHTLRVADAVQASNAFPGMFHPRAFPVYEPVDGGGFALAEYRHLIDGGVYDNSGLPALLKIYDENRARFPKGCVLLVVNSAWPILPPRGTDERADLRSGFDFLIDVNSAVQALDLIFEAQRREMRERLQARAAEGDLRFVEFVYAEGALSAEEKAARAAKVRPRTGIASLLDFGAPFSVVGDVANLVTSGDLAPTQLSISDEFAEKTRAAACRQVAAHLEELRKAGLAPMEPPPAK